MSQDIVFSVDEKNKTIRPKIRSLDIPSYREALNHRAYLLNRVREVRKYQSIKKPKSKVAIRVNNTSPHPTDVKANSQTKEKILSRLACHYECGFNGLSLTNHLEL